MGVTTLALFLAKYHSSIIDFSEGQSRIQPLSSLQVLQTLLIFFKSACPKLYVCYQMFSTHGILSELKKKKIKGYTNCQSFQRVE